MTELELHDAINQAETIAILGTTEEKEGFVSWACNTLAYLSSQGDKKGVNYVKAQYNAYLVMLNANNFKRLRLMTGMSQQAFSEYLSIPKRTIEDWENERRIPPQYLVDLVEYKLKAEKLI